MIYRCLTCDDEFSMKPNAQKHAKRTGHINMKEVEESDDD